MNWLILSLISIVLLSGCATQSIESSSQTPSGIETTPTETTQQTEITPPTSEITQPSQTSYKGQVIDGDVTKYIRFNWDDYQKTLSEGKVIYFYFYANWCPICREERPKILDAFSEMSYPDVIGFEVHFNDNEVTEDDKRIAREFGISYQHTTVIHVVGVDKTGKEAFRSFSPVSKQTIKDKIASLV